MNRSALVRFVAFLGVLAVLLGYVAYHKTPSPASGGTPSPTQAAGNVSQQMVANYIANLKQHRDSLLTEEIATLKSVIADPSVSPAARRQAAASLVQDQAALQQDMKIEGILAAQGIDQVVAMVGTNGVQIIVGQTQLTPTQVGRIADTAIQVTGLPPEDVVIVPRTSSS
jgi:hypothetical protein